MKIVLDTSVLVLTHSLTGLPDRCELAVSSASYAELAYGVSRASGDKTAPRELTLSLIRANYGTGLPFDDDAASRYGYLCAATEKAGRKPRAWSIDLVITATAMSHAAGVATVNVEDFSHLAQHIPILPVSAEGNVGKILE